MAQSKKPRRPYKPRAVRTPMIVGTDLVMRPLEAIIDQISRDGTVDASSRGVPMFKASDGMWYDSAAAIEGIVWHFEMFAIRHKIELPIEPLRELHIALKYCVPVFERTVTGCKLALPELRRAMSLADPDEQLDILMQAQIKEQLQGVAA